MFDPMLRILKVARQAEMLGISLSSNVRSDVEDTERFATGDAYVFDIPFQCSIRC
jgi:hypothetical protein